MRLLRRFLRDLGSEYEPCDVVKINNKRFASSLKPSIDSGELLYSGFYLGQNKQRFEPSSILLQKISKEDCTHKAYVNRETAWLFVVGKDVFDENIIERTDGVRLGGYCLVIFNDRCIGYGRYESSRDLRVVKNIYDIGDFLRREQE
jgi:ribosome biogenesis protein Nip4